MPFLDFFFSSSQNPREREEIENAKVLRSNKKKKIFVIY